jgi:hypothetical protein
MKAPAGRSKRDHDPECGCPQFTLNVDEFPEPCASFAAT